MPRVSSYRWFRDKIQLHPLSLFARWHVKSKQTANSKLSSELIIVTIFFVAALMVSLPALLRPMIFVDLDAYSRFIWGYSNFLSGKPILWAAQAWLPNHISLLSLSFYLFGNNYFSPRILTLILSAASVSLMYVFSKNLFQNLGLGPSRFIAFISATIYLFFPFRLILATVTLSEPVSMFLLLCILSIITAKKTKLFFLLALLIISQGFRYEFWFILPLVWFFVLNSESTKSRKMMFLLISLGYPILWLIKNYHDTGSPLFFLSSKLEWVKGTDLAEYGNFRLSLNTWLSELVEIVSYSGLFLLLVGIYKTVKNSATRIQIIVISMSVFFLLLLVIQVFSQTMEWFPFRYLYTVVVPIIPFIAFGLYTTFQTLFNKGVMGIYFPISMLVCLVIVFDLVSLYINAQHIMISGPEEQTQMMNFTDNFNAIKNQYTGSKVVYVKRPYDASLYERFEYFTGLFNTDKITTEEYSGQFQDSKSVLYVIEMDDSTQYLIDEMSPLQKLLIRTPKFAVISQSSD